MIATICFIINKNSRKIADFVKKMFLYVYMHETFCHIVFTKPRVMCSQEQKHITCICPYKLLRNPKIVHKIEKFTRVELKKSRVHCIDF